MIPFSEPVQVIERNVSYENLESSLEEVVRALKERVIQRGDLPYISSAEQCRLIDEMSRFDLGRFLLKNRALNGHWTHYVAVEAPAMGEKGKNLCELEQFFLFKAPSALATQERYTIFQREIQKRLCDHDVLASVPCGIMADLIDLDDTSVPHIQLVGIDLDENVLLEARNYALEKGKSDRIHLYCSDAWSLNCYEEFDLLTSNGLHIYESSDERVILIFQQFFQALKSGGTLITSYFSPPPIPGTPTEWKLSVVDSKDALLQKVLLADILQAKWQAYRSQEKMEELLKAAGFENIEFLPDKAHIMPVVIAKKRS
jgi:SAM-dependent methyltransferase